MKHLRSVWLLFFARRASSAGVSPTPPPVPSHDEDGALRWKGGLVRWKGAILRWKH